MLSLTIFLIYIFAILLITNYYLLFIIFLINFIVAKIARINLKRIINSFIIICTFSIVILLINLFIISFDEALIISLKFILVCNIIYIFSKILTPMKMMEMLEKMLFPIQATGRDTQGLGILICITIAFIPILKTEIKQVLYGIKAKCINITLKNLHLIVSPMILNSLKKSDEIELSLKAKAYK